MPEFNSDFKRSTQTEELVMGNWADNYDEQREKVNQWERDLDYLRAVKRQEEYASGVDRYQDSRCSECGSKMGHFSFCSKLNTPTVKSAPKPITIENSKHYRTFLNPSESDIIHMRGMAAIDLKG